jgi:hypothetical protein
VTNILKTVPCYKIWPFLVNYKSVKFYSAGPRASTAKHFTAVTITRAKCKKYAVTN